MKQTSPLPRHMAEKQKKTIVNKIILSAKNHKKGHMYNVCALFTCLYYA